MRTSTLALPLAIALLMAGCTTTGGKDMLAADAPRALPESGPVGVHWNDPATFTELRHSRNRWDAERGNWVSELATYMRKRAEALLPNGERLELTITDVDRAGDYEPWHGMQHQDTRIVRDIYPPRMTVQVKHFDARAHWSPKASASSATRRSCSAPRRSTIRIRCVTRSG